MPQSPKRQVYTYVSPSKGMRGGYNREQSRAAEAPERYTSRAQGETDTLKWVPPVLPNGVNQ